MILLSLLIFVAVVCSILFPRALPFLIIAVLFALHPVLGVALLLLAIAIAVVRHRARSCAATRPGAPIALAQIEVCRLQNISQRLRERIKGEQFSEEQIRTQPPEEPSLASRLDMSRPIARV